MNIVTIYNPTNTALTNVVSALASINQISVWNPHVKPAFDMFAEIKPDMLLCTSEDFTPDLIMALQEYKIRLVVFGLQCPEQITPELLCGDNCHVKIAANVSGPFLNILPAANIVGYNGGCVDDIYRSDVLVISNAQAVRTDAMLDALTQVGNKYQLKICGTFPVSMPQYLGKCTARTSTSLLMSTSITLDFNGHIMMEAAYHKTFCMSNVETAYAPRFNPDDLLEQVDHFMESPKHRKSYVKKMHSISKDNTCFNRGIEFTTKLGLSDLTAELTRKMEEVQ